MPSPKKRAKPQPKKAAAKAPKKRDAKAVVKAPPTTKGKVPLIADAVAEFEQPYSLPLGCEYEAVRRDISRYFCFEFEDAVYIINERKSYERVSNFTCHIHMHIVDEVPTRLISIRNEDKEEDTMHVAHDVFNGLQSFRKVVTGRGNYKWMGSEAHYMRYLWLMMDRMGKGRMVLEPGQQPEGFFAFSNMVLHGEKVIALDKFGCFDVGTTKYYIPAANTTNLNSDTEYGNARKVTHIVSPVSFDALSSQMLKVHGEHSMLAQVHAIGTVFSDYIRARIEGYPVPFYYGPPGTGKDENIKGGQRWYGIPQSPVRLPAGNTSPGIVNVFAELRNIPLYCTEWSSRLKPHMHEFCMGIYDGEGRRRGEKIQAARSRYATEYVPVRCTASMSGNEYPNYLDQLLDRLVVTEMKKLTLDMDQRANFRTLKDMEEQGYSHHLTNVVRYREEFIRTWFSEHYQRASEMVKLALRDRFISERMRKSVCILMGIHLFFATRLQWSFTPDQLLAFLVESMVKQQSRRLSGDEVSSFWSAFISGVNEKKLVRDRDFHLDSDGSTIGFYWGPVFNVYMERHKAIFGTSGQRDILNKLKQHDCFVPGSGPGKDVHLGYRIGKGEHTRKSSAYVFDTEKTGTDLVGLLENVSAYTDAVTM